MLVPLGATRTRTLLGSSAQVMAPLVTLTVHPSPILRAPGSAARAQARRQFVNDLKGMARKLERTS